MAEKRLSGILSGPDSPLAQLKQSADAALTLREQVIASLPAQFRQHVEHASLDEQRCLTLYSGSQAWCARLRYEEAALKSALLAAGIEIDRLLVRSHPGMA